jgi:hypothetical protein
VNFIPSVFGGGDFFRFLFRAAGLSEKSRLSFPEEKGGDFENTDFGCSAAED